MKHLAKICAWAIMGACLALQPVTLRADAITKSTAMFADTIAEYFVEEDRIRVELEIGQADIPVFRNLLPDAIYQELGYGDEPLAERFQLFTGRDFGILADGAPLPGFVEGMGPSMRPLRDEITGEPLPTAEDEAELVIGASLVFPFDDQPSTLELMAPVATGTANIGFVLYHQGVAVNDFRYLGPGFIADLDWDDPWYSRFPQRSLRRQYEAPMTGFIYVEPYEVRKEIIVRPKDIQRWVDLGLEGESVIPADRHDEIKRKVVEFIGGHFPVSIDGVAVQAEPERVNFLRRTLRSSVVVDNQDLELLPATMGIIYVFPTDGLPQKVEMTWDLFFDKMQRVPSASVDQAGPLPIYLEPDFNVLTWENFLKKPVIPSLVDLRPPPSPLQQSAGWLRWIILAVGLAVGLAALTAALKGKQRRRMLWLGCIACFAASAGLHHVASQARMDAERVDQLVGDLLTNIYRAFDFRGEETIYDILARSVSGNLLTDIYLETRKGLELVNQGGARVKVKEVLVTENTVLDSAAESLQVESRWNVAGSVGHWGHVHQRSNAYRARLSIQAIDGAWKLTGIEILEEERL